MRYHADLQWVRMAFRDFSRTVVFQFIQPTILALLTSYNAAQQAPPSGVWPSTDYDTIWTVTLDAQGNVTVDNAMCEGINSAALPATPPQF